MSRMGRRLYGNGLLGFGAQMKRWIFVVCLLAVLGCVLGACSSSSAASCVRLERECRDILGKNTCEFAHCPVFYLCESGDKVDGDCQFRKYESDCKSDGLCQWSGTVCEGGGCAQFRGQKEQCENHGCKPGPVCGEDSLLNAPPAMSAADCASITDRETCEQGQNYTICAWK
jgi:hypothetical protein